MRGDGLQSNRFDAAVAVLFGGLMFLGAAAAALADEIATVIPGHGYSPIHELKYGQEFAHFDYADPAARKGGKIHLGVVGTFDSLNFLRYPGAHPRDISGAFRLSDLTFDSLLAESADEPAGLYGRLADTVEVADDLTWARFRLREEARWHDGAPITAADILFTVETLYRQGVPYYRQVLRQISVEAEDSRTVVFRTPVAGDKEFVGIVGLLPIHPRHFWNERDVTKSGMSLPMGSGPYRIVEAEAGRRLVLERVVDYWGRHLAVNRGRYNFGRVEVEFFRDNTVALEAFKAGHFDIRVETNSVKWATGYDGPALSSGEIRQETLPRSDPGNMTLLTFNLRRQQFQDIRVRRAIALAYDFDWSNRVLFHGLYREVESYYGETDLSARGAASPAERAILGPFEGQLPNELFQSPGPTARGGRIRRRAALGEAAALLDEAGFVLVDGKRIDPRTGRPLEINAVYLDPGLQRVFGSMARNLERLGIALNYPFMETTAAQKALLDREFDMAAIAWAPSLVAGNAERLLWGSAGADRTGTYALAGAKDPALDAAIDAMIRARDWKELTFSARAFDRVLRWRCYAVPLWRSDAIRLAHWDRFDRPANMPGLANQVHDIIMSWWYRDAPAAQMPRGETDGRDGRRAALPAGQEAVRP